MIIIIKQWAFRLLTLISVSLLAGCKVLSIG
jgi:hypothetical protein